jgi:hypothetical protein
MPLVLDFLGLFSTKYARHISKTKLHLENLKHSETSDINELN